MDRRSDALLRWAAHYPRWVQEGPEARPEGHRGAEEDEPEACYTGGGALRFLRCFGVGFLDPLNAAVASTMCTGPWCVGWPIGGEQAWHLFFFLLIVTP